VARRGYAVSHARQPPPGCRLAPRWRSPRRRRHRRA
jgi:hypothetical protein